MSEKEVRGVQTGDWPLGGAKRTPQTEPPADNAFNRLSRRVHGWLAAGVSNLRLSLTLRIAMHYAWQLLRTTLPAMLIAAAAVVCSQLPMVDRELDALSLTRPENGRVYSQSQLLGTPFDEAKMLEERLPDGLAGFGLKWSLAFSEFEKDGQYRVWLYLDTARGGFAAAWRVTQLCRALAVLLWALLLIDLYRVAYFLHRRNRLNRKVLKPIADMAETAAKLSANNLSDRISVEGAKNELKDLALVINGMLDRIELSYNSQKQFVSDASHELRTPIAVIQGYVGMLQRWGKTDPEVLEEGIGAIAQEASSMKELVERLLFLARHDKKTLMLEVETFDPLEVMSEVHREAKMLSAAHRFELAPAHNALISGDKDMLKQLMRILVDNAIKYTPEGGSITLGVKKERGHCLLTVTDTGEGISADDLTRIFDRFYRCDGARKAQTSGHGLGLSIARIIVSAHGGKLKVRSKVGAGTTFSVILPLENE